MPAPFLVLAVGNESRGDDALGPLLLRQMDTWIAANDLGPEVELIEEFQLQVEHTLDLAGRQLVLFLDAGANLQQPFRFYEAIPRRLEGHTSHAIAPEALLGVYVQVHGTPPPAAFVLCVAGESFELGEPLSASAGCNLCLAFDFACRLFEQPEHSAWQSLAQAIG